MSARVPASRCRRCGVANDAATGADNNDRPTEGAISICFRCGTVSLFRADLTVREPTVAEVREMLDDPHVEAIFNRMWDRHFAIVVKAEQGVAFACGCRTTGRAGLFVLEACSENCVAAQMIMRLAEESGRPFGIIQ